MALASCPVLENAAHTTRGTETRRQKLCGCSAKSWSKEPGLEVYPSERGKGETLVCGWVAKNSRRDERRNKTLQLKRQWKNTSQTNTGEAQCVLIVPGLSFFFLNGFGK